MLEEEEEGLDSCFSACESFFVLCFFVQRRGGISYQPTDKKALYVRMLGEESCFYVST